MCDPSCKRCTVPLDKFECSECLNIKLFLSSYGKGVCVEAYECTNY